MAQLRKPARVLPRRAGFVPCLGRGRAAQDAATTAMRGGDAQWGTRGSRKVFCVIQKFSAWCQRRGGVCVPKLHVLPRPGVRRAVSLAARGDNTLSTQATENTDLEHVLNVDHVSNLRAGD